MRRAIAAAAGEHPRPNPRVGAVVLDAAGTIVGEAVHRAAGEPHAEVLALEAAGERAGGGTLLVTLEPCAHHGRTPPCVEAIIAAGVSRVVVGAVDPDPRVSGRGMAMLRQGGVAVRSGVLEGEVEAADPGYFHQRRTGFPRVVLKAAATIDGQTAASDGSSQWITSSEARRDGHELRAGADAIMVGAGTVLADDPRLDVRIAGYNGHQPVPVVVAGRRPLPADRAVFGRKAVVLAPAPVDLPADVIVAGSADCVDLEQGLRELAGRGILDVLVEGGPRLAASLLAVGRIDRMVLYVGAMLAGGVGRPLFEATWPSLRSARPVHIADVRRVGPDLRVDLEPEAA